MKRFLTVLFLILAVGLFPTVVFAQHSSHGQGEAKALAAPETGAVQPDFDKGSGKGKRMHRDSEWVAKHEQLQQELSAMDKKLDDKVAAMNAAKGDEKVAAMSEVINELASQRKQMVDMFRMYHIKMSEKMKGKRGGGMMHKGGGMMQKGGGMGGMHGGGGCCAGMQKHHGGMAEHHGGKHDMGLKETGTKDPAPGEARQ